MATYNDIKKIKIGDNVFNLYDSGNSGGTITSIKTTAGAHTAIDVTSGAVSFNVPTTAEDVGIKFGYTTSGNNRAVQQDSSGNLYVIQKDNNTNTTYTLSGALSSHKFTSTLTAGGSGSGTSTSVLTLAAGSNITLTDNTSAKAITIAAIDTKYSAGNGLSLSGTTFSSKNSNLVNGSATGSVRGINTAAEDSSYTMGANAFAEGVVTTAEGVASHSEGAASIAYGNYSHAEGSASVAYGIASHSQNEGTLAQGRAQTAIGKYNVAQGSADSIAATDHAFIIGNGTANDARSNALTVDWSGNVDFSGKATDSTGNILTPSVELTQAEYDALTEDEKNNGTVYFITDGIPQNEIASYSNQVLSLGNLRIYKGYKLVSNTGRSSITFPSGTFSQVLWAISFCDQPGFGGYDTTSVTELTTSKVTLYQYNSAGANMNVGVVVFGLA